MLARRLNLLAASAGALIVLLAAGIYFGSSRVDYDIQRGEIARQELESYLKLSESLYRYFHLEADALLVGEADPERGANRRKLTEAIAHLKALTKQETLFVRSAEDHEQELDELDRIADLERELDKAFRELEGIRHSLKPGEELAGRRLVLDLIEERIDGRINKVIAHAIEDEAREVLTAEAEAHELLAGLSLMAQITATGALLATTLLFVIFTKRIGRPISLLVDGIRRVSSGDLSHRLAIDGKGALADVAKHFDDMVAELETRDAELRTARADLEVKVQDRTRELDAANKALQHTDQLRQQFLSDVSHELRTPITVVQGEAEITLRGRDKGVEEYKRALQHIKESAGQLSLLVSDLLFMARTSAGTVYFSSQAVDLASLLETVRKDAEILAGGKSVQIAFRRIDGEVVVLGDRQRLRQLFLILLDNAIRYSVAEVNIALDITRSGDRVETRVCDNGSGMSATELDCAFDRFYRGDGAQRSFSEGSGLGLPLAKSIVEAHKGEIVIESTPGQGTTVTVDLPAAQRVRPAA